MNKGRSEAFLLFVIALLSLGLIVGVFFLRHAAKAPARINNTATVLKQVQTLSELVTVKYVFEKIVPLEDRSAIPFGLADNKVLLIAHGIVKAGPDFSRMQPSDLEVHDHKVVMTLPRSVITDAYLDDKRTQVLERSTGLLRTFDKDLEQNARRQAISQIMQAARENAIEKEADDRARAQLANLFKQLGFTEVVFRTQEKRP